MSSNTARVTARPPPCFSDSVTTPSGSEVQAAILSDGRRERQAPHLRRGGEGCVHGIGDDVDVAHFTGRTRLALAVEVYVYVGQGEGLPQAPVPRGSGVPGRAEEVDHDRRAVLLRGAEREVEHRA